jgi:hypothetical protein
MILPAKDQRPTERAHKLLEMHETAIIKELGSTAFDLLTPKQSAALLGIEVPRLSDLVRQGWVEPSPAEMIGPAKLYYRWRIEFARRYRGKHSKKEDNE